MQEYKAYSRYNVPFTRRSVLFSLSACNEVYNSTSGIITSPDFPNDYPNNAYCRYLIRHPDPTSKITIKSLEFDTEWHRSCGYESVKIYDGDTANSSLLGSAYGYCGHRGPPTLTSTGNALLIVFVSDHLLRHHGFILSYKIRGMF